MNRLILLIALVFILLPATGLAQATEPFIGQLACVPFNFAPKGWALCNGQLLSIAQNQSLYALLGTTYGGNGQTTFGLPDLRGRVPISAGQGPGLSNYNLGQLGGEETHTLTLNEIPSHTHALNSTSTVGSSDDPTGNLPAKNAAGVPQYGATANGTMSGAAVGAVGEGHSHNNMQPYLTLYWIIALEGVFPSPN